MLHSRTLLALIAPFLLGASVTASGQVTVGAPWVRGTVAGQAATGAYMQLRAGTDTTLVGATSPVAALAEIHEMAVEAGVMRMRPVPRLALAAGRVVDLKPGGYHVMLLELKRPLREGEVVPVTLHFEGRDGSRHSVEVSAQVRGLGTGTGDGAHRH